MCGPTSLWMHGVPAQIPELGQTNLALDLQQLNLQRRGRTRGRVKIQQAVPPMAKQARNQKPGQALSHAPRLASPSNSILDKNRNSLRPNPRLRKKDEKTRAPRLRAHRPPHPDRHQSQGHTGSLPHPDRHQGQGHIGIGTLQEMIRLRTITPRWETRSAKAGGIGTTICGGSFAGLLISSSSSSA